MVRQTIQIFARVKPTKKPTAVYTVDNEEHSGGSLEFVIPRDLADGFINNKRESYRFRFLKVFDQATKQEEIFETIAKPVADNVLAGYNGTIFAYGQTGSGKTFTITGGAERYSDRGIIPRTLSYLYQHFTQDSSMVYTTQISYLEIYNEVGYDLLDPRHEASNLEDLPHEHHHMEQPPHPCPTRPPHCTAAAGVSPLLPQHEGESRFSGLCAFLGLLLSQALLETPMNQASTRSHCIFTIHLCGREPGSATLHRSKLHLVDLAGSERVGKSGVGGQILTEAKYINLSLHYLEQVITALSEKNRSHIPYRNSMMTSVLRDSLGGNCMTTMIATVSSEKTNIDESISTCRFAQRVALIKNEALVNEELDPALLIVRLKKEIQCLKEELAMVTGEQRTDELSQEEIQRIEEQVKLFLDDPDPDRTLDLGPDMRKIHHCFSLLKERVQQKQQAQNIAAEASALSSSGLADRQASEAQGDLLKLKDLLTQRDNEIRPELSIEQQEAFEIFRNDHGDRLTLEDNKAILKQRFAEAKALGEQVNQARNRVNSDEMERLTSEHNLDLSCPKESHMWFSVAFDRYKSTFGRLKGLKTEIEHLQHLLQRSKIKLKRDFQDWWSQEATRLQVP
ncbi:hypothetical protein P4O66_001640 [Electrophorus voltai]|uniref:Kinesin-like protein n=1 Tax=Electrophorus voltai TaxID=2609070 RepID=A0AAD8Z5J4_9TELE|nr:hypothetical protein P4O66_001640 [Electrophorus voltai]